MKRAGLIFLVFMSFAAIGWAEDGDRKDTVVGAWTMGFCQAEPFDNEFGCTTQLMTFHEDGTVWSSFMFDQDSTRFGGLSVGALGRWHHLGDHRYFVTMLRFANAKDTGYVAFLLRTDLIVEIHPRSHEAVTTRMVFLYFKAVPVVSVGQVIPYPVVTKDPYEDPPDSIAEGPRGIPMKRIPAVDPNSPVFK